MYKLVHVDDVITQIEHGDWASARLTGVQVSEEIRALDDPANHVVLSTNGAITSLCVVMPADEWLTATPEEALGLRRFPT